MGLFEPGKGTNHAPNRSNLLGRSSRIGTAANKYADKKVIRAGENAFVSPSAAATQAEG
jgi:hypothetical protein